MDTVKKRDTSTGSVLGSGKRLRSQGYLTLRSKKLKIETQNEKSENNLSFDDLEIVWNLLDKDYNDNKLSNPPLPSCPPPMAPPLPPVLADQDPLIAPRVPLDEDVRRVVDPDGLGLLDGEAPGYEDRWQRQVNTWETVKKKFGLADNRYCEFEYLLYLNINDPFVENYINYHLGICEPLIKCRLRNHLYQWEKLNSPKWLLSTIRNGVKLPFKSLPPTMVLPNNKTANTAENIPWIRNTLLEFIRYGFVKKVFVR